MAISCERQRSIGASPNQEAAVGLFKWKTCYTCSVTYDEPALAKPSAKEPPPQSTDVH